MPRGIPKAGHRKTVTAGAARGLNVLGLVGMIVKLILKMPPEVRDIILALVEQKLGEAAPAKATRKKAAPKVKEQPKAAAPRPVEPRPTPKKAAKRKRPSRSRRTPAATDGGEANNSPTYGETQQ